MAKRAYLIFLIAVFLFSAAGTGLAQNEKEEIVKGTIQEISKDGSYIVVDGKKIVTTKEFLEESYLEVGDNVEITAQMTKNGLEALDYKYLYDEEPEFYDYEYEYEEEVVPQKGGLE